MTGLEAGKSIVVGVDGSKSSVAALEWAARQAALTGAGLSAVTSWQWPRSYGGAVLFPSDYDPAQDAAKVQDEAVRLVQQDHAGLEVRPIVVEGHPAEVLVEASEGAELLVVGSRGHGELAGMLLGSVSEYCVTHAHCPVVVIRA